MLLPYKIDLKDFLKIGENQSANTVYILRGFITYYGRHYISFFYSEKLDQWMQLNDSICKPIGNFK